MKKREDAQAARDLQDALHKFDATVARFDAYEAELAHDPEDDLLSSSPATTLSVPGSATTLSVRDGTDPSPDPSTLAHPQKPQQQPAAIGDEENLLSGELTPLPVEDD